jgi:hypothetical protein
MAQSSSRGLVTSFGEKSEQVSNTQATMPVRSHHSSGNARPKAAGRSQVSLINAFNTWSNTNWRQPLLSDTRQWHLSRQSRRRRYSPLHQSMPVIQDVHSSFYPGRIPRSSLSPEAEGKMGYRYLED